jgi:hypothetical protein
MVKKLMEGPQLMVLTNMQGMHGAGAMFYPDQLETIAQQMGTDFLSFPLPCMRS